MTRHLAGRRRRFHSDWPVLGAFGVAFDVTRASRPAVFLLLNLFVLTAIYAVLPGG